LKTPAFTVINYRRELNAQKLDDDGIHFLYPRKFCKRPTMDCNPSEQSHCSVEISSFFMYSQLLSHFCSPCRITHSNRL